MARDEYWSYDRYGGWVARKRSFRRCRRCGGPAVRVSRRFVDRVYSLVRPVRRYQCRVRGCGWTGNLPRDGEFDVNRNIWVVGLSVSFVSIVGLGLLFMVFIL